MYKLPIVVSRKRATPATARARVLPKRVTMKKLFKSNLLSRKPKPHSWEQASPISNDSSHFQHRPLELSQKQIRILRLEPSEDKDAPIHVTLKHIELSDDEYQTAYKPVSYVWGEATPNHEIKVHYEGDDWATLTIRDNLHQFLMMMRSRTDVDHSEAWYFIDQISINQTNVSERNHQVMQMAKVFKAREAIIWFGPASAVTAGRCTDPDFSTWEGLKWRADHKWTPIDEIDENAKIFKRYLNHVNAFFRLDYWTRAWCTQEFLLPEALILFLGDELLPDPAASNDTGDTWTASCSVSRSLSMVFSRSFYADSQGAAVSDWQVMLMTMRGSISSDPRDQIFSCLGLVPENRRISVDYDLSIEAVFTAAVYIEIDCILQNAFPITDSSSEQPDALDLWGFGNNNMVSDWRVANIVAAYPYRNQERWKTARKLLSPRYHRLLWGVLQDQRYWNHLGHSRATRIVLHCFKRCGIAQDVLLDDFRR